MGFAPKNLLTFRIAAPAQLAGQEVTEFYQQVAERIRSIPGVQSATVARDLPMSGVDPSMPIVVEGKSPNLVPRELVTRYRAIGEDYFRTLQIPMLQGRPFDEHDSADAPYVAIVSESLAHRYWPGRVRWANN